MASTQQDNPSGFRPITVDVRPGEKFRPITVGSNAFTAALVAQNVEPPRSGAGSNKDAWATYADSIGATYSDDATRDDIIAAVDSLTSTANPTPDAGEQKES